MKRLVTETTIIIFIALLMFFFQPQASDLFAYYHNGISQGQWWRIFSNSFCHTNFNHLLMNLCGLLVILTLFINSFKQHLLCPLFMFATAFISLCLYFIEPSIIGYVGLSGTLHGLFSYGVCRDCQRKDKWGYLLGLGLIIKLGNEQIFGASQNTVRLIDAPVLVNAHLYGALAGLFFFICKDIVLKNIVNFISNNNDIKN